jgi:putative ABC transport system permease protein
MLSLVRSLTFRYLLQKWDRSLLVALSIALGVGMLVSTRLLNQCVDAAAKDTTIPADVADLYVTNGEPGVDWSVADELNAARIPGVKRASRFVSARVDMPQLDKRSAVVFGMDASLKDAGDPAAISEMLRLMEQWKISIHPVGNAVGLMSGLRPQFPLVIISRRLHDQLKAKGVPEFGPVELRYTGKVNKFIIAAVVDVAKDSPYAPFADNIIAMDAADAAKLTDRPSKGGGYRVTRVDLFLEPGADVESVRQRAQEILGDRAPVRTPEANRKSTEEVIGGVKLILNLCSLGALVVGLFIVYIVLWVTVSERRHDIGVMRSLGATRRQIAGLFAIEAVILGALGALPGIPLGVGLAELAISLFDSAELTSAFLNAGASFQPELNWETAVLAVLAGMVVALLAALIPSLQAASDQPADAVRRTVSKTSGVMRRLHRIACVVLVAAGLVIFTLRSEFPSRTGSMAGMTMVLLGQFLAMPIFVGWLARLLQPVCRMFLGVEARLAADNLIRAPGRTGIVIGALAAGVSLMFMTAGVGKSNEVPVREWLQEVIRADAFLFRGNMVSANSSMTPMEPKVRDELNALPGVERVVGLRFYRPEYRGTFILLLAMDARDYQQGIRARVPEGLPTLDRMADLPDGNFTIISENFAAKWDVKEGDLVTVPGPRGPVDLTVIGIGRDYSWSQGTIFMDRKKYAELFGDDLVDAFHVFFKPEADHAATFESVREYSDREDLVVQNRESVHLYLAGVLDRIFQIAYLQQIIVAIVAALGVVMALLISVLQRRRELGLLRAVGATRYQVLKSVLAEAMLMGLIGTILGFLLGYPMEWFVVRVVLREESGFIFDVLIPWKEALGIGAISVLTSTLAGFFPALHAVRLNITEAIAYE